VAEKTTITNNMGIKDIPIICYSHSSYEDVRVLFFNQLQKHLPEAQNLILFTDKLSTPAPNNVRVVLFDDSLTYPDRVAFCLDQIQESVCIFHHEDMMLYDRPDTKLLDYYIELVRTTTLDYIKLLKGGETRDIPIPGCSTLFHLPHDYALSFTIQPAIWKVNKLKEIYANSTRTLLGGAAAVGNFELLGSEYVNISDIHGAYHFAGEDKRGGNHWNSKVYPHGNYLFKGSWVYSEYKKELDELFEEYDINPDTRGSL